MASVASINISKVKGTIKTRVDAADIDPHGLVGDAHAGPWHRQISLLSHECIERFAAESNSAYPHGSFAENITTLGLDLSTIALRDRITVGGAELEITQIGKRCHGGGCAIYQKVGRCVMPKEGLFARVITPGSIRVGDPIVHHPTPLVIHTITLSDRASRGEYADRSGPAIVERVQQLFAGTRWHLDVRSTILPDDAETLRAALRKAIDNKATAIFTTGGTGIGPRDITPDVVAPLLDKPLPGIMEFIRVKYGATLPAALLSRGVAGVAGQTLVYTLPGSVKAVNEYCDVILPTLEHSLLMLMAVDAH